jgi:hypothetical protein
MTYSQTPASVAGLARFADSRSGKIDLVRRTVPLALLAAGLVLLLLGLVLLAVAPRRPRGRHAR